MCKYLKELKDEDVDKYLKKDDLVNAYLVAIKKHDYDDWYVFNEELKKDKENMDIDDFYNLQVEMVIYKHKFEEKLKNESE